MKRNRYQKRRTIALFLSAMMVLTSAVVLPVTSGTEVGRAASSILTKDSDGFYLVRNFSDLDTMQDMIEGTADGNDYSGDNFRLASNINGSVGSASYLYPIGDTSGTLPFTGEFDGNNKTISNITIKMDDSCYEEVGLFEVLSRAKIYDLTFDNCKVEWDSAAITTVSSNDVGLIAGQMINSQITNVKITNCDCNPQVPSGSTINNLSYVAGSQTGCTFTNVTMVGNAGFSLPDTVIHSSVVGAVDKMIAASSNPGGTNPGGNTPGGSGNDPGATSGSSVSVGDTFTKNKIKYLVCNGDTLEVKGLADNSVKHMVIPDTVKLSDKTYRVTRIAAKAFLGNKKLLTAKIGKNIEFIGKEAFKNCTKLKEVRIGISVKETTAQLSDSTDLLSAAEVVNVTISASAFENCFSLSKVIINCQVRVIGNSAFCRCNSLRSIVVYSKILKTVGKKALKGVHNCKISVYKIKLKPYKALFKNRGQGKKVVVIKM